MHCPYCAAPIHKKQRICNYCDSPIDYGANDKNKDFIQEAISLLKGKKAFLASRDIIDKVEACINDALMEEKKGIYYFFLAYIRFDYFERKYLNIYPDYKKYLALSEKYHVTEVEIEELFEELGIPRPKELLVYSGGYTDEL